MQIKELFCTKLCASFLSEFDWVVARRQFKITLLSPDYRHLVRTNTKLHN